MGNAASRGPGRFAPWLAWTVAVVMLHAWGCGTSTTDATDTTGAEAAHNRAMSRLAAPIDAGGDDASTDAGAAIDAGDAGAAADGGVNAPCTGDVSCNAADYCSWNGTCQLREVAGTTCNVAAGGDCLTIGCRQCVSGFCDNGVCCGTGSCPTCESCNATFQQPFADGGTPGNGTCAPVAAGTDPYQSCTPNPNPFSCSGNGLCDGTGACQTVSPVGTACGTPACSDGGVTKEACNGAGTCLTTTSSCAPYLCATIGEKCATSCESNDDCVPPATCNVGTCGTTFPNGTACGQSSDCSSGNCVDEICCNAPCAGQCQACDVEGNLGTCFPVTGTPHGDRASCTGEDAGSPCAGACDGTDVTACGYPGATTACGLACTGSTFSYGSCTNGTCGAIKSGPCNGGNLCQAGGGACATSCATSSDCVAGYACWGNACSQVTTLCVGNTSTASISGDDAGTQDCSPYLCQTTTGQCTTSCTSASDCAPGGACSNGQCGAETSKGCSCDVVGGQGRLGGAWLFAVGLGLGLVAKRRRRAATRALSSSRSSSS